MSYKLILRQNSHEPYIHRNTRYEHIRWLHTRWQPTVSEAWYLKYYASIVHLLCLNSSSFSPMSLFSLFITIWKSSSGIGLLKLHMQKKNIPLFLERKQDNIRCIFKYVNWVPCSKTDSRFWEYYSRIGISMQGEREKKMTIGLKDAVYNI